MPNEVPGCGPSDARIMIIGEAPSTTEVRLGAPFVGKAGEELNKLLQAAKIDRSSCYVTNICLEPVQGDKEKFFFPRRNAPSEPYIRGIAAAVRDIQRINPNVIVPLGNYALWGLTMHRGIMAWRGSILRSALSLPNKLVPTIHPAALLRGKPDDASKVQGGMWKMRPVVIWDLERANYESRFPEFRFTERRIQIAPSGTDLDEAVHRLLASPFITVDIESFGGTRLACVGLGTNDPTRAWVIPWGDGDPSTRALLSYILGSDNPKRGQNLMYDVTMLDQNGLITRNVEFDTMLAAHVLLPELPKGLDFLTSIYTDIPYYKPEGKVWKEEKTPEVLHRFFNYNGKDVCATTEVSLAQERELASDERHLRTFRRELGVFQPLREATYHGAKFDEPLFHRLVTETTIKKDTLKAEIETVAGPDFNPNSPKQVAEFVYGTLQLAPRMKGGKLKTDAKTLKDVAARSGNAFPEKIVEFKKQQKLLSNYYNEKIVGPDGRLRSSYNIAGTISGRLSSSAPLWGPGLNGQNVPVHTRRMYVADEGFELWELDQSQAEAVVTAYLAEDPVHMDCFRTGKDVHRVTACYLLDMDPERWQEIPKDSTVRQLAKKCNHAFNYDMGWMTFMMVVNGEHDPDDPNSPHLEPVTARALRDKYMSVRTALPGYWERIRLQLRQDRTLVTPLGRVHIFMDQWSDTMIKQAYSWIPQSTVGDATNEGIIQTYASEDDDIQYLFKNGMRLWGQVHDSVIWQVPLGARQYAPKLMEAMEVPMTINGHFIVIPIDGAAGHNWDKYEMETLGKSRETCEVYDDAKVAN